MTKTITVTLTKEEVTWLEEGIQALCADQDHSASEKMELAELKDKLNHDGPDMILRQLATSRQKGELDGFGTVAIANAYARREGYLVTGVWAGMRKGLEIAQQLRHPDRFEFGGYSIPFVHDPLCPPDQLRMVYATDVHEYIIDNIGGASEET